MNTQDNYLSNPLVSISCITFNHAPYIRQCLDGFLMQKTNFHYEVLIHDDASTDGTTEIIQEYASKYPDIIKPRWGMGSLSIFKVEDLNELDFFYNYAKKEIQKTYLNILTNGEVDKSVIIQEFITGKEYNLDVFNDLDCNYFQTITKEKIAMRSGETDIAKIVENKDLVILGEKLSELFKHRGNMDVDVLQSLDGQFYVLEMNMRFGGGYPFSHQAGANFPELLISAVNGEKLKANKINIGYIGFKSINIISSNVDSLCH